VIAPKEALPKRRCEGILGSRQKTEAIVSLNSSRSVTWYTASEERRISYRCKTSKREPVITFSYNVQKTFPFKPSNVLLRKFARVKTPGFL
jgi:hypothetical protein